MSRKAEHDDICGYCGRNIWANETDIGTSPFFTPKPGESKWIHTTCTEDLKAAEKAKEQDEAEEVELEEFDEPGPYDGLTFLRIRDVADRTGLRVTTLRRLVDLGYAEGFKKNGRTYVNLPRKEAGE